MYDYTQDNLSISNNCHACMLLDSVCQECEDSKTARDANIAHEIVDEGNLQYKRHWFYLTEPSGHDWTSREGEFKPPIVHLEDGGVLDTTWELDDERQRAREIECKWCHIMTPKHMDSCQSCDKIAR